MRHIFTIAAFMASVGLCIIPPASAQPAPAPPQTASTSQDVREAAFSALNWDRSHLGAPLNMGGYKLTFEDNFDILSVTPDGGKGPWFAPIHSDVGSAVLLPPGPGGPFSVADGVLTIRAEKVNGKWQTGLMQTVDSHGQGFVQQYGYFEMRAQFPASKGAWPAFWLLSQNGFIDKAKTRAEIDIVEWYGGDPKGHHATVHLWPAQDRQPGQVAKHLWKSHYTDLRRWDEPLKLKTPPLKDGRLEGWHTYGSEVTPEWVIVYFDRQEVGRFPTQPEYKTPLYMLVDLTLYKAGVDQAISPMEMKVDYVRAYAR